MIYEAEAFCTKAIGGQAVSQTTHFGCDALPRAKLTASFDPSMKISALKTLQSTLPLSVARPLTAQVIHIILIILLRPSHIKGSFGEAVVLTSESRDPIMHHLKAPRDNNRENPLPDGHRQTQDCSGLNRSTHRSRAPLSLTTMRNTSARPRNTSPQTGYTIPVGR